MFLLSLITKRCCLEVPSGGDEAEFRDVEKDPRPDGVDFASGDEAPGEPDHMKVGPGDGDLTELHNDLTATVEVMLEDGLEDWQVLYPNQSLKFQRSSRPISVRLRDEHDISGSCKEMPCSSTHQVSEIFAALGSEAAKFIEKEPDADFDTSSCFSLIFSIASTSC